MRNLSTLWILALAASGALAAPVTNGGFEEASGELPAAWTVHATDGCDGGGALDNAEKAEGTRSLRLWSKSEKAPHVYCGVQQVFRQLLPGITYTFRVRAKGKSAGNCWYGGGSGWRIRHRFPEGSFDWREFSMEWTCPPTDQSFDFRVNVDSATEALWIDDVRIEPELVEGKPQVRALSETDSPAIPLRAMDGLKVDGVLNEWAGPAHAIRDDAGRIDATLRVGRTEAALCLAVEAKDDSPMGGGDANGMWQYDSIQIALDPKNERSREGYGPNDYEIGIALSGEKVQRHAWYLPEGVKRESLDTIDAKVVHANGKTSYEVAIPWQFLAVSPVKPGHALGLNVVVNDRDTGTDRAAAQWTPGMFKVKQPVHYKTLVATDGPWAILTAPPAVRSGRSLLLTGTVFLPEGQKGTVSVEGLPDTPVAVGPGLTSCQFITRADKLAVGKNTFTLRLKTGEKMLAARAESARTVDREQALALIAQQEERLPSIEAKIVAAEKAGKPVPYSRADYTVAKMFVKYCHDDMDHERDARALEVAQDVKDLLDRAEREVTRGVDVPRVDVGTISIRDGSFWGTCRTGEVEEERPIFLTGYGHFSPVIDALPLFPDLGLNVIQVETGPKRCVFEDRIDTQDIKNYVIRALDKAYENGACVCLLLSPHYFPGWALDKHPELRVNCGFLKNSVDAPEARCIYEMFIRTVIPMVKDHPALQSICLSNEPVYFGSATDPFRQPLWQAYVKTKYQTVGALNAHYGTSHASFKDVPHPELTFEGNRAALYDAVRFNQQRFAEWHAWMAGLVREMAPELPCHAKVMALPAGRRQVFWGTDPRDFAQLSQINGNDCYFMPHSEDTRWASMWHVQGMYYDLQRSMKKTPIFNSENHIIHDRESRHVDASHIYTAIWQGAIHGQGGSTTWAWQRTYDRKSDFEGLILHRAACTAAMSRCSLDLMRLGYEVAALQNVEPEVALLYSHAATLADEDYVQARRDAYQLLNFCGVPVGFVTDEQAAAGGLGRYKCLVVPGAGAVLKEAADAIRAYVAAGGSVLRYGESVMVEDESGSPIEPINGMQAFQSVETARKALAKAGIAPPYALHLPDGTVPLGIEWRCASHKGVPLVNMVNLTRKPMTVVLPEGCWTDRITGQPLSRQIALDPNTPVLAARE